MIRNLLFLLNKESISLIITIFFSTIIFFSNESKLVEKIETNIIDLVSNILIPQKWYTDLLVVKDENFKLKEKIVQLNLLNSKLNNYKIENERLRSMLRFKESYAYLSLQPANVMNHNFSSSPNSILIDVGKNKIKKNQAVIDMNGLIGKTISIGNKASKVQIITDKNFAVSVKVGNKMEKAIFKPDYGDRGFLEGVVKSVKLKKNDIIYSSGLGEIYPPDIPVCKILEVSSDNDKPYQNVIVEILADITNLNYVFVIQ